MTTQINEQFTSNVGEFLSDVTDPGWNIASGYLYRCCEAPDEPCVLYSDCSADLTIEWQIKCPGITTADYDYYTIYRYQDNDNFRYVKLTYNAGNISIKHGRRVTGTYTDESTLGSQAYTAYNILKGRLLVRGNYIVQLTLHNSTSGVFSNFENVSITSTFNTETHCGLSFPLSEDYYTINTDSDTMTNSLGVDYFIADDVLIWTEENHVGYSNILTGGVLAGGAFATGSELTMSGGVLTGTTFIQNAEFNSVITGGVIAGSTFASSNLMTETPIDGVLIGGENVPAYAYISSGGVLIGSLFAENADFNNIFSGGVVVDGYDAGTREWMNGGVAIGGIGRDNQHYSINVTNDISGGVLISGYIPDLIPVLIGGGAVYFGESSISFNGGVIIGGAKYPGGYKYRRIITIPANTFTVPTDFYLGIKYVLNTDDVVVRNSTNKFVYSHVRSFDVETGLVHIFFSALIIDPTIDNIWYVYY